MRDWVAVTKEFVVFFVPGMVVGGLIGWFAIRPVNNVLGWLFRGFNRLFDRADRRIRPWSSVKRTATDA